MIIITAPKGFLYRENGYNRFLPHEPCAEPARPAGKTVAYEKEKNRYDVTQQAPAKLHKRSQSLLIARMIK